MTPYSRSRALAMLCGLAALTAGARAGAAESYDNCDAFIDSLPTVVSSPGVHCLRADLSTSMVSGTAIEFIANIGGVLDCKGHSIDGSGAGPGTATYGIFLDGYRGGTLRNCHVRGFAVGVYSSHINLAGQGALVEDNLLEDNTRYGIFLNGVSGVVRRNRIRDTGGSSAFAYAVGISADGEVSDNSIVGVRARTGGGGSAWGLITSGVARGNRVAGVLGDGAGVAEDAAIDARIALDNQVSGTTIGIRCETLARRNTVVDASVGIADGCPEFDNVVVP